MTTEHRAEVNKEHSSIDVWGSWRIDWMYPGMYAGEKTDHIEIDLYSVRASDGIRIHYDSKRDGWVIEQPTRLQWPEGDDVCDPGWQEVAFVQSWQLRKQEDEDG